MESNNLTQLQQKVSLLRAEGKYKETIEESYNLLDCGWKELDYKSILIANINMAASYYCIGDIEEAFKCIEAYEEVCKNYGDEADYLNLYNVLFLLYEYNKVFDKAKETLKKSIELGEKLAKFNIVSNGYSNYSHICIAEENYEAALEMGTIGLEKAKLHKPSSLILEYRVKLNIAQAYIGLGDFKASKILISEIIQDSILDYYIREKAQCYVLQGSWHSKQNLFKEAFDYLTFAKDLVESYHDVHLLKDIQEERCRLCEKMNDIQLGFIVQKEYISLLNEISTRELAFKALKLDIKHSLSIIEKQANTDYLTGLFNRNYLETRTNDWLKKSTLTNGEIVCIVFDIDNFKSINDKYGHLFGDEVIKLVGHACFQVIGNNNLIGRYGGDEFVVILKDTSLNTGIQIATKLEEAISHLRIKKDEKLIEINASIGIADNSDQTIQSFNDLFHRADLGLYKAKQNGKNQMYIYTDSLEEVMLE